MVSEQDMRRIAAEAGIDVRTVRRLMSGQRARSSVTRAAVAHACAELGFDPPPLHTENTEEPRKETDR